MILKYPSFQHSMSQQQQKQNAQNIVLQKNQQVFAKYSIAESKPKQIKTESLDIQQSQASNQEEDILKQLENEREIMRLKFTYLGDLMMAMDKFENHGNVNDMKEFLLKNNQYFNNLIEQIYQEKAVIASLKSKNQQMEKQISQEEAKQKEKLSCNQKTETKKQQQLLAKQLETELSNLKTSNASLINVNKQILEKISKKDFFREYDFMSKEADGLKKQNEQLKQQIQNQIQK